MQMRNQILPLLMAATAITIFVVLGHGLTLLLTFVPAMLISVVLYYAVTQNSPLPASKHFLTLYWLALAVQFLHFAEEFVTGFNTRWPVEIFNTSPYDTNAFVVFNMLAWAMFVLGGLALYRGIKFPMLIVWFFVVMGVLGNGIQHPIYAFIAGGYFPGLYTSFLHLVLGVLLITTLIRESAALGQANEACSERATA